MSTTTVSQDRILTLLKQNHSASSIQSATGASLVQIKHVASTYQISTLNQRVFDLLCVGHAPSTISTLTGMGTPAIRAIGASESYTQTEGFGPGGSLTFAALAAAMPFVVDSPDFHDAAHDGSTDDTAAIQAAINNVVSTGTSDGSYYGEVWFSPHVYAVTSATTKGGATKGNAQITIPIITTTGKKFTLVLKAAGVGSGDTLGHWDQTTPDYTGTTILSTLVSQSTDGTWGRPSILGGPTAWTDPNDPNGNNFSNMKLHLDGLKFSAPNDEGNDGPTLYGVDTGQLAQLTFGALGFTTSTAQHAEGAVEPNPEAVALRFPNVGSNDNSTGRSLSVEGWPYAIEVGDHVEIQRMAAVFCGTIIGVETQGNGRAHGLHIGSLSAEYSQHIMFCGDDTGTAVFPVVIDMLATEDIEDTWFLDTNNQIAAKINGEDSTGNTPTLTGGKYIRYDNLRQARGPITVPSVPASGTAFPLIFRNTTYYLTGGTVSGVTVAGIAMPTTGAIRVPSGTALIVTYSAVPTLTAVVVD